MKTYNQKIAKDIASELLNKAYEITERKGEDLSVQLNRIDNLYIDGVNECYYVEIEQMNLMFVVRRFSDGQIDNRCKSLQEEMNGKKMRHCILRSIYAQCGSMRHSQVHSTLAHSFKNKDNTNEMSERYFQHRNKFKLAVEESN